jgi:hypothetical protein
LKKRERRLELLYELSQEIVNNPDFERVMFKLAKYIGNYFNSEAMLFIYDGEQETSNIYPNRDLDINEQEITSWVINNGIAAGKGTDTFSDSEYHFYPINSTNRIEGVIILKVGSKLFGKVIWKGTSCLLFITWASYALVDSSLIMEPNLLEYKDAERIWNALELALILKVLTDCAPSMDTSCLSSVIIIISHLL